MCPNPTKRAQNQKYVGERALDDPRGMLIATPRWNRPNSWAWSRPAPCSSLPSSVPSSRSTSQSVSSMRRPSPAIDTSGSRPTRRPRSERASDTETKADIRAIVALTQSIPQARVGTRQAWNLGVIYKAVTRAASGRIRQPIRQTHKTRDTAPGDPFGRQTRFVHDATLTLGDHA
jgi:hypothetical protein